MGRNVSIGGMISNQCTILIIVATFALTWGIMFLALRFRKQTLELRHRERIVALERGIEPLPDLRGMNRTYVLRGLIWLFVGIGLSVFFIAMWVVERDPDLLGASTLGLVPAGVGFAYLLVRTPNPAK